MQKRISSNTPSHHKLFRFAVAVIMICVGSSAYSKAIIFRGSYDVTYFSENILDHDTGLYDLGVSITGFGTSFSLWIDEPGDHDFELDFSRDALLTGRVLEPHLYSFFVLTVDKNADSTPKCITC